MRATSYEKFGEWRVEFDDERLTFCENPSNTDIMLKWIKGNITGDCYKHWQISHHSMPPFVAFLDEEDAMLCFLAFQ